MKAVKANEGTSEGISTKRCKWLILNNPTNGIDLRQLSIYSSPPQHRQTPLEKPRMPANVECNNIVSADKRADSTRERLSPSQRFFYEHAGYSYDKDETPEQGRERCARELAAAEIGAAAAGWTFEWTVDLGADSREFAPEVERYALWSCVARDMPGEIRASLSAIDFGIGGEPWGAPYRRVVQAELACGFF